MANFNNKRLYFWVKEALQTSNAPKACSQAIKQVLTEE